MNMYGEVEIQLHTVLMFIVAGSESSAARSDSLTPGVQCIVGWVVPVMRVLEVSTGPCVAHGLRPDPTPGSGLGLVP